MGNLTDGMDIARVREVASQLKTEAGRIDEVNQNGTTQVGTLGENWLGNDSEQFASSWQSKHSCTPGTDRRRASLISQPQPTQCVALSATVFP